MPNSKYPNQLDTSVEIPPVRDNITEVGSDIINSLRSAIFKIESTLGINPQGSSGNSVASRISKSLDDNGNILKEALDRANILSGPILDTDVSNVASIKESKLKLDFPTKVLQSEISTLDSQISQLLQGLEEISTKLSIHLNPASLNSHFSKSISVSAAPVLESNIATLSLEAGNLQTTLEKIYNAHINYTGLNISNLNNSHTADQIYYDNSNTSNSILSNNLQGALDGLVAEKEASLINSISSTSSNGRIRRGRSYDAYEGDYKGSILFNTSPASYSITEGASFTIFSITTPTQPLAEIEQFDVLTLTGSQIEGDNKDYQVKSVSLNGSGLLESVTIYGSPSGISASAQVKITKNPYIPYNIAGFSAIARPRKNKTNTPDVQVLNPDSATIISSRIRPENITSTNHTFNISVDGGGSIEIETYNSLYSEQTLDTIVQKINDQSVDNHLNFTAFKVRTRNCYELAISHNVPNILNDNKNRTLKISTGATSDGTSELGFSDILDIEYRGKSGNSIHLNGKVLKTFGLIKTFTNATIDLIVATLSLSLSSGTFSELGVRVGDLVVVDGSSINSDDGTYRIASVSGSIIELDLAGTYFAGSLSDSAIVHIIRASAPVYEFEFEEISGLDGTILFDVFLSEDQDIFQSKRLELEGSILSGSFRAVISDVSRGFIVKDEVATLNISASGYATLTDPSLLTGPSVFIGSSGTYKLFSYDGLSFITLTVESTGLPASSITTAIYGFNEVSSNNYPICRAAYATGLGRILGTVTPADNGPGIPVILDKRNSGTADHTVIGESFVERFVEGPRSELRGSGVIRGCEVVGTTYVVGPPDYQTLTISSGILVVNGIRFEFPGIQNLRVNTDQDYIVAIDSDGCILAQPYIADPSDPTKLISPFYELNVAYLAEVTNDGTTTEVTDLRLFIDNLDLKLIGDIKVSNDPRNGHFTDISKAVQYSKRFQKMFPSVNSPSIHIENGIYTISETVIIDFDVTIRGSGVGTILKRDPSFISAIVYAGKVDLSTSLFLIGGSQNSSSTDIVNGVTLKDFTYEADSGTGTVSSVIALTQPIQSLSTLISPDAMYRFENINFIGPTDIDGSVPDSAKVGEFALYIGQQNPSTLNALPSLILGNVLFSGCRVVRMGLELGGIGFTGSLGGSYRNIIVSQSIISDMSPNLSDMGFVLIKYPTSTSTSGIIEASNVRLS